MWTPDDLRPWWAWQDENPDVVARRIDGIVLEQKSYDHDGQRCDGWVSSCGWSLWAKPGDPHNFVAHADALAAYDLAFPLPDCMYIGGNEDASKCNSSRCPRHRMMAPDLTPPSPPDYDWISVYDALPDAESGTLFLATWRGQTVVVQWQPGTPHLWTAPIAWGARMHEVTHWQPLPAPAVTT